MFLCSLRSTAKRLTVRALIREGTFVWWYHNRNGALCVIVYKRLLPNFETVCFAVFTDRFVWKITWCDSKTPIIDTELIYLPSPSVRYRSVPCKWSAAVLCSVISTWPASVPPFRRSSCSRRQDHVARKTAAKTFAISTLNVSISLSIAKINGYPA